MMSVKYPDFFSLAPSALALNVYVHLDLVWNIENSQKNQIKFIPSLKYGSAQTSQLL